MQGGEINISAAAGSCFTLCHFKPVFGAVIFTYPLDELPDIL